MKEQEIITISLGFVKAFLIKGDRYILVDTGIEGKLEKIKEELRRNNVNPRDISLIICTHNHGDHVGELYNLKELTGAKVAVHRSEADSLSRGETIKAEPARLFAKVMSRLFRHSGVKPVKADILVDKELRLNEFGVEGRIIHTPGHTQGSLTIVVDNSGVIVGDMLSGKKSGQEFKAALPIFSADMNELKESMQKIIKLAPMSIYNSHGIAIDVKAVEKLVSRMDKKTR